MKYKIKQFLKADISKIYILGVGIICLLLVGGYFSLAIFTVNREKNNAISIITGNLTYKLEVDGVESNTLTVAGNTTKDFTVTLTNPNNRIARFNFYYLGSLPSNVEAGYKVKNGVNTTPPATGVNLEMSGSSGSSNTYSIRVVNNSSSSITITLGVQVGLDYNDLSLPSNGHLFEEAQDPTVAEVLLAGVGENGAINTTDPEQTFITGTDPNNYIWYSGKLWRAVSIDPSDNSVKLVTQWTISTGRYNSLVVSRFSGSNIETWLNDTSVDGFLGNLREPEKFIKMDSVWNATLTTSTSKPESTTMVTDAVGLLNIYEYTMSYSGTTARNGYLNNGLHWWLLSPCSNDQINYVYEDGSVFPYGDVYEDYGIRPSINLKSNIQIVDGDGTEDNPYRLLGDYDSNLNGTYLNTRYSGEYIRFGNGENNLYRIVSHETTNLTKITSAEPLKSSGEFIVMTYDEEGDVNYSSTNTIGIFLNGEYLTDYVGSFYSNMIEPNTTWYLGMIRTYGLTITFDGYKYAKYTNATDNILTSSITVSTIGLLRYGELMTGQINESKNNEQYWLLTPEITYYSDLYEIYVDTWSSYQYSHSPTTRHGVKPSLNLKSNVIITGGDGTKQNPFTLALQ